MEKDITKKNYDFPTSEMTARDHYAMAALMNLSEQEKRDCVYHCEGTGSKEVRIAKHCFKMADAMLKVGKGTDEEPKTSSYAIGGPDGTE